MKKLGLVSFLCILPLINGMEDNKELINIAFRKAIEKAIKNPAQKTFPEIETYLNIGADINYKNPSYKTALIEAVENLNKKLFDFLLQHNADINIYGPWGSTPLSIIMQTKKENKSHSNITLFDIEKDFLQRKANPNAKKINGDTIFTWATRFGASDLVKLLIKYNAKSDL